MTEKAKSYGAQFHPLGLGRGVAQRGIWTQTDTSDVAAEYELKSLQEIKRSLAILDRPIDILKVDIEGYELQAFDDILAKCDANVREVQVELHWVDRSVDKHSLSKDAHHASIERRLQSFFKSMRACNFYIYNKELSYFAQGWKAVELCFVNMSHFLL
ncbi:hypothetical protein CYMTET_34613 [Cymbomonas tetramitiformis]|uniref:Methyltransferase domain-containing protein n=1 Tax=Cymbomonas tetramitiformis TaxID=36881 RepID=A0AAE0FAS8_9CHLO|nr:hypothetical protein CYMTET_34613 [Cymbomonas tetramitiformis]